MTPREKELLSAALRADAWFRAFQPGLALTKNLTAAVAAYDNDNPQADHEACLARRVAEDGPPPVTDAPGFDGRDGGRMHINSIGAELRDMSKHTPGPWTAWNNGHYWQVDGSEGQIGDACASKFDRNGKETPETAALEEANARLISAAPDLLEACKLHAEWIKREHDGPTYPPGTNRDTPGNEAIWHTWFYGNVDLCDRTEKATIAAIAKAEGK